MPKITISSLSLVNALKQNDITIFFQFCPKNVGGSIYPTNLFFGVYFRQLLPTKNSDGPIYPTIFHVADISVNFYKIQPKKLVCLRKLTRRGLINKSLKLIPNIINSIHLYSTMNRMLIIISIRL